MAVIAYFLLIVTIRASGTAPNLPGSDAGPTTTLSPTTTTTVALGAPPTTTIPVDNPYNRDQTRRRISLSGPRPAGRPIAPDDSSYIYYAIALIVGFREETFRRLLRRASDVILTPGDEPQSPSHLRIAVEPVKPKEMQVGEEIPILVTVTDQAAQPRVREMVRFVVTGAHDRAALGVTDQEGRASFRYKGATIGDDTIRVFVDVSGDGIRQVDEPQDVVEVRWTAAPASPAPASSAPATAPDPATADPADPDPATPDPVDPATAGPADPDPAR